MAANRIKGITIEIGGDTTKLQTALKGVNTEVKNTQQQLKDVEKLLKLDSGNTELLAQKHKLLGEAVSATKEKLETLKTAAEQANTALARLTESGVELRLREMGKKLGVEKVHPHKFRRTMATRAIEKGMPIEQVQKILGHEQIDTTLRYAMVNQNNVKLSHRKYIS